MPYGSFKSIGGEEELITDEIEYFLKDNNFPIGKKKESCWQGRGERGNLRRTTCVQQKREKADKAKWILDKMTVKNKILKVNSVRIQRRPLPPKEGRKAASRATST